MSRLTIQGAGLVLVTLLGACAQPEPAPAPIPPQPVYNKMGERVGCVDEANRSVPCNPEESCQNVPGAAPCAVTQ